MKECTCGSCLSGCKCYVHPPEGYAEIPKGEKIKEGDIYLVGGGEWWEVYDWMVGNESNSQKVARKE